MRKLTMLAVVLVVVVTAAFAVVPALCANGGANSDSCDIVAMLRGTVRIVSSERCQQTPQPVGCPVLNAAGLTRK